MANASLWHPSMSMACTAWKPQCSPLQVYHLPNAASFSMLQCQYALVNCELNATTQTQANLYSPSKNNDQIFWYINTLLYSSLKNLTELRARRISTQVSRAKFFPAKLFELHKCKQTLVSILESRNKVAMTQCQASLGTLFFRVKVLIRPDLSWLLRCFPWTPGHMRLPSFPTLAKTMFFSCDSPGAVVPSNPSISRPWSPHSTEAGMFLETTPIWTGVS